MFVRKANYINLLSVIVLMVDYGYAGDFSWSWTDAMTAAEDQDRPGPVTINLKHKVEVEKDEFVLADISFCKGNKKLCGEATGLIVSSSPKPGGKMKLFKQDVLDLLAKEWQHIPFRVEGADFVSIYAEKHEITAEDLKYAIQPILKKLEAKNGNFRIHCEKITLPKRWIVRPGLYNFRFIDWEDGVKGSLRYFLKNNPERKKIWVVLGSDSKETKSKKTTVYGKFIVEKKVLVARSDFQAGQAINSHSFMHQWIPLRRNFFDYPESFQGLENFVLKVGLKQGSPIRNTIIKKPRLVKRGEMVRMQLGSGNLEIFALVRAIKSGSKGDTIDVVYEPTKKKMQGVILDQKLLREIY